MISNSLGQTCSHFFMIIFHPRLKITNWYVLLNLFLSFAGYWLKDRINSILGDLYGFFCFCFKLRKMLVNQVFVSLVAGFILF